MLKKPIVVNLIAAPGSGKSTIAAGVFEELKWRGINAELITEFAKDKVWEENPAPFKDGSQLYLLGKQFYRMNRCRDGVDVLITDSPLCLTSYYLRQVKNPEVLVDYKSFDRVVENLIDSFDNLNYFLVRTKKYNPKGRFQTEEESDQMAIELKQFFEDPDCGCDYTVQMEVMDGNREAVTVIADAVLEKIRSKKERAERRTNPNVTIGIGDDDDEESSESQPDPYTSTVATFLVSDNPPSTATFSGSVPSDEFVEKKLSELRDIIHRQWEEWKNGSEEFGIEPRLKEEITAQLTKTLPADCVTKVTTYQTDEDKKVGLRCHVDIVVKRPALNIDLTVPKSPVPSDIDPTPDDIDYQYALSKFKAMCMTYNVGPVTFTKETPKECFGDFWPVEKNSKLDYALGNFFRINYVIPELNKCQTMRELIDFIKKCQAEQKEP